MDCVAVTSLLGRVEQLELLLLQKPPHNNCLIFPDDAQIILSTLKDKLHFLQAYLDQLCELKSCEAEKVVLVLHKEIIDVAVKAEDEMESKLGVYLAKQQQGECTIVACEDLHRSLQQAVMDIESVEARIRDHHLQMQIRHTPSLDDDASSSIPPPSSQLENIVVGVEDDVEYIKRMLIPSSSSSTPLEVFSIWGMPGSGTTTLAKTVYQHPSIVSHFDIRAWAGVSQRYSRRKFVVDILGSIVSLTTSTEISNKDDEQLALELYKFLKGQRYLIVIDNVWSVSCWDDICMCFPDNSNGSRVLITTPYRELAAFTSSGMSDYQTPVRKLNLEESWELLTKTAASNEKCCLAPEFESIGIRIVEKCGGVPLGILLIGGLLRTLNNSPNHWEDIQKQLKNSSLLTDPKELFRHTIEVCYSYLPSHLKACFLYLGVFPENTEIHVKKLIKLWVAEGYLKPEMNKSFEEIVEDYLCDLINRRLVQIHTRSLDGKIKSCMLHDSIYGFCLAKAREEDIMMVSDEYYDNILEGRHWVSCQSNSWPITPTYFNDSSLKTRSLLSFGENLYLTNCWLIFSSLKLLRVLDLSFIKYWHGMPSEIVDLIHLRYLALTTIGSLYSFQLFKLQSLQTLILSSWTKECQLQLPCDVLDLPWLRHVRFDKGSSSYLPNLVQENLQTLSWFKVTGWDSRKPNFTKVPSLKELGIYIEGEVLPDALDSLAELHQLEKLKFKMGRVERFNLPNSFPSNLKQLTLSNTYLSWEDMDIIGKLPNLHLLKLKDFACCGPEWTPKDGEFLQLQFFLIERSDLEHWNANASHFPVLERLILRYCWDLEKLPNDFKEVYTLRLIELDNCCSSLVTSAMEIQKWQRESRYNAVVVGDVTKVELPTNESSEKRSESAIW